MDDDPSKRFKPSDEEIAAMLKKDGVTVEDLKIDEPPEEEYEPLEEEAQSPEQDQEIEFDYVIPTETYRQHHRHRRHRHHHRSSSKSSSPDEAFEDYVFASHSKKHRKHRKRIPTWLRVILIILAVILGLAIIAAGAFFIMHEIGRGEMHNYDDINIVIPLTDYDDNKAEIVDKGRTIEYNGTTYRLNEDIMTVTFIGYKKRNDGVDKNKFMGDAIYIIAIDSETGKTTVVGVSRDTMADVDVYSAEGHYIDTEKRQLTYAYSYGSSEIKGGQNVNTSLSRLFFGLPLNNYFAIDLEAVEDLNDAIGGVTVNSLMEFDSDYYGRTIQKGEEVTLHGSDAAKYIQSRDISELESNNDRMDRQQQYIKSFLSSIVPAAKKDLSTVTSLFGVVSDNADTTLTLPRVAYLATAALTKMRDASEIEYVRLTGEIQKGEHAEMVLKDQDILETMLKVFYTPVGRSAKTAPASEPATEPATEIAAITPTEQTAPQ